MVQNLQKHITFGQKLLQDLNSMNLEHTFSPFTVMKLGD